MSHSTSTATSSLARDLQGVWGDAWRWARVGREALSLLSQPLRRQGIDGLEVSDSTYEEWMSVQSQFEERVRAGSVRAI